MKKQADSYYHFQVKSQELSGGNYGKVKKSAERLFLDIKKKTKRLPYIRSAYFHKEKIFLNLFWDHLRTKSLKEKTRRLKLLPCAIELLNNSRNDPEIRINRHSKEELFYRFYGKTPNNRLFIVQVKRNIRTDKKYLMSFFRE